MLNALKSKPLQSQVKALEKQAFKDFKGFQAGIADTRDVLKQALRKVDYQALQDLKSMGYEKEVNNLLDMYSVFELFQRFYDAELETMQQIIERK